MPKKRKSNLSRKTHNASQMSESRLSETPEQREDRLNKKRILAKTAINSETRDQREDRLNKQRILTKTAIDSETREQCKDRLNKKRVLTKTAIDSETPELRDMRLSHKRQYAKQFRESEDELAHKLRLQKQRCLAALCKIISKRNSFYFSHSNVAFLYDPMKPYQTDPAVDIGKMSQICVFCKALKYAFESDGMCCSSGKVKLPLLEPPPDPLNALLTGKSKNSQKFLKQTRQYNSAFQMTSFGVSKIALQPGFMSTFKIQGQVCHRMGSLLPDSNQAPKFLQIYFVGGSDQERDIRCDIISDLDKDVVMSLQTMLHAKNHLLKTFKTAIEYKQSRPNLKVVISADKKPTGEHPGRYNAPTTSDVASVTIDECHSKRDIVIQLRGEGLQTISETNRILH